MGQNGLHFCKCKAGPVPFGLHTMHAKLAGLGMVLGSGLPLSLLRAGSVCTGTLHVGRM